MGQLTPDAIKKQSDAAYNQWAVQWREQAKIHAEYPQKSWDQFRNVGIGKACLLVANGWSLELEMDTIRRNQGKVDILCCDKSLGHLIRNGIKPTYCLVADANVDYEKYLKPYETQLDQTVLFINVCANPKWTANGNWKDVFFYVNMDILGSEKEFGGISGCKNVMPAGTNVSNAMVILLTQCDNTARRNFFGYDKMLLIGFDYGWNPKGHYYAYDPDGGGKANYMRHMYVRNRAGEQFYTSNNLAFSAVWLSKYCEAFRLPVVQCTKQTVFLTKWQGDLAEQMQYNFRSEDSAFVRKSEMKVNELRRELASLTNALGEVSRAHFRAVAASV